MRPLVQLALALGLVHNTPQECVWSIFYLGSQQTYASEFLFLKESHLYLCFFIGRKFIIVFNDTCTIKYECAQDVFFPLLCRKTVRREALTWNTV
jgi:hypothetical protein